MMMTLNRKAVLYWGLTVLASFLLAGYTAYATSTISLNLATDGTLTVAGESNLSTLVFGGSKLSTTTNAAGTFTAAQMCDNALITATPNVGAVTLTMPTAALLIADCIPATGDTKLVLFENATTTAGITTTLAAGAAVILTEHDGGDVVIPGDEWAEVMFVNLDGTNVYMRVMSVRDAD